MLTGNDIVQQSVKQVSMAVAKKKEELFKSAICRALGWLPTDIVSRGRLIVTPEFETLVIDGEPILEIGRPTYRYIDGKIETNVKHRFLGAAA